MEDEDQALRALGHFVHRWGRLDRFESLNEHWLELEAQMRTDFNIFGTKLDFVRNLKSKSRMRAFFRKSGVPTVPQHKCSDLEGALHFLKRVDYPVVVKPDSGAGASMTYKIANRAELDAFFAEKPADVSFVMEDFVDGLVVTYDGIVNRAGEVVFAGSTRYDQSIMDVVNRDSHMSYVCAADDRSGRSRRPAARSSRRSTCASASSTSNCSRPPRTAASSRSRSTCGRPAPG